MDNIFEILIYLFIIVTFLSSIFKKKKPKPQKPESQVPQQREEVDVSYSPEMEIETSTTKSSSTDEYDVLKELEQFFKVGEPKPKPLPQQIDVEQKKKTAEESWRSKTKSEHMYEDIWEKKRRNIASKKKEFDSLTFSKASKFEELLKEKKVCPSIFQRNIKEKIMRPASLKKYIIISEILGKPKALKHR
ncbi:MAG: hypothetical protein MUO34_12735 [Ignavibacteriaceae bacterium]|nr:hypothetical protein [Ignavibacteriaceae bacterium]